MIGSRFRAPWRRRDNAPARSASSGERHPRADARRAPPVRACSPASRLAGTKDAGTSRDSHRRAMRSRPTAHRRLHLSPRARSRPKLRRRAPPDALVRLDRSRATRGSPYRPSARGPGAACGPTTDAPATLRRRVGDWTWRARSAARARSVVGRSSARRVSGRLDRRDGRSWRRCRRRSGSGAGVGHGSARRARRLAAMRRLGGSGAGSGAGAGRCGRRRGRRRRMGQPAAEGATAGRRRLVVADPDAEVDVRDVVLGIAGRARLCDGRSFDDATRRARTRSEPRWVSETL